MKTLRFLPVLLLLVSCNMSEQADEDCGCVFTHHEITNGVKELVSSESVECKDEYKTTVPSLNGVTNIFEVKCN